MISYFNDRFGCFQVYYPELQKQFEAAELSPYNNLWWNIHDFTPCGDEKNWSLLGECYKVQDFLNWQDNQDVLDKVHLSFDKSVVPLTIGNRRRNAEHTESSTLVLIFKDEIFQIERAARFIEEMQSNKADQTELIKTRELFLEYSDAERLFSDPTISQNCIKGSMIALQVSSFPEN